MRKRMLVSIVTLLCLQIRSYAVEQTSNIDFNTVCIDYTKDHGLSHPKTPVKRPKAYISDYTLYIKGCNGCTLQLIGDNDIVYTTVISNDTVELPEEFTGTFRIEIIRGNYCFWAEIEL